MKIAGKLYVAGVVGTAESAAIGSSSQYPAWAGFLPASNKLTEWDFGDAADAGDTKDGLGNYLSISSSGDTTTLNITVIPLDPASPGNIATAKSNVKLPPKMGKVTITGTGIAAVDGDWHYSRSGGGSIKPDATGQALKVTMKLERFDTGDGNGPKYIGDAVQVS